ncbi:MAG: hypothetical protein R6U92_05825 [Bacillota bacterium]
MNTNQGKWMRILAVIFGLAGFYEAFTRTPFNWLNWFIIFVCSFTVLAGIFDWIPKSLDEK